MRVIMIVEKITITVMATSVPSLTSVCPRTMEWTTLCLSFLIRKLRINSPHVRVRTERPGPVIRAPQAWPTLSEHPECWSSHLHTGQGRLGVFPGLGSQRGQWQRPLLPGLPRKGTCSPGGWFAPVSCSGEAPSGSITHAVLRPCPHLATAGNCVGLEARLAVRKENGVCSREIRWRVSSLREAPAQSSCGETGFSASV